MRRLQRDTYGAIISDVGMPGMDGPACENKLGAVSPALAHPIIFVIEGIIAPSTQVFLAARDGRCVQKPFTAEELRAVVQQIVSWADTKRRACWSSIRSEVTDGQTDSPSGR